MKISPLFSVVAFPALLASVLHAWDYPGHRMVNQLALRALPADFPEFVRAPANAERIAFLAGEPDRWRNVPDAIMRQTGGSWTDHFLDIEQIPAAGLDPATVPSLRLDFAMQFAAGRAAHPGNFPAIDPAKNSDHTREWPGFLPWRIAEDYAKLKSGFSYLKVLEELGTPEEIANAKANIVYVMGTMGHFLGDGAQPLHTTHHHNGWVGPNPHGYTTAGGIHTWIDGGFIAKAGITLEELVPKISTAKPIPLSARADGRDPLFAAVMDYVIAQNRLVETLYAMDKESKFRIEDKPPTPEGRAFIDGQLRKGGEMLASLWVTAWKNAPPDTYLRGQLVLRQSGSAAPASPSTTKKP